jgi:hypothetical protein
MRWVQKGPKAYVRAAIEILAKGFFLSSLLHPYGTVLRAFFEGFHVSPWAGGRLQRVSPPRHHQAPSPTCHALRAYTRIVRTMPADNVISLIAIFSICSDEPLPRRADTINLGQLYSFQPSISPAAALAHCILRSCQHDVAQKSTNTFLKFACLIHW